MSLFGRRKTRHAEAAITGPLFPSRAGSGRYGAAYVTNDTALRVSAVWACIRLRANLISTFPCDVFRKFEGLQLEMPKPPVLVEPGGRRWKYQQWMYASQTELDRAGNAIGLITEVNALGLPARVDLFPLSACSVRQLKGKDELEYRIDGKPYPESKVWHERQYVVPGLPVGLSPIAYAAWTIGEYQSAQQFALDWFGGSGVPKARLRNTQKTVNSKEAAIIKDRHRASVSNGDLFVYGNDFEYDFMQAESMGMEFLELRRFDLSDIARFFDCPSDLIDAAVSGQSVTYANMTQRNLQFLIMSLGPAVFRRETALSDWLPKPRFIKLNTDALLRMDPATRAKVIGYRLDTRQITPSEGRALENLPPYSAEQIAEIERVYGSRASASASRGLAEIVQKIYLGVGKVLTVDEAREILNQGGASLPIPAPDLIGAEN